MRPAAQHQDVAWGGVASDGPSGEDGVDSASADTPSHPRASCPGIVAGKELSKEDMIASMDEYYQSLPCDSFCEPWAWRPTSDQTCTRLPSSCMLRQKLDLPQPCEPADVASIVLPELLKIGDMVWVDDKLTPVSCLHRKHETTMGKLPLVGNIADIHDKRWELDSWPADEYVDGHIIVHNGNRIGDFAFVGRMPTKFHYRLMLEDLVDLRSLDCEPEAECSSASGPVRLEAVTFAWQGENDNGLLFQVARHFHRLLTGVDSPIYMACIRVTGPGTCIDLRTMQQALRENAPPSDMPHWLPELARRVSKLRILEHQIAMYSPVHPAPNPVIMENILYTRSGKTRDMLAVIGKGAMREMAALALYVDYPMENANGLGRRFEDTVSDKTCAGWMLGGGSGAGEALLKKCSVEVKNVAEATTLFHALVGAHFLQSGPSQVANLWAWLSSSRELDSAVRHMHPPAGFAGRTETYTELHWVKGEQLKEMESFKPHADYDPASDTTLVKDEEEYLFVVYEKSDHALYRKGYRCPEELRHQTPTPKWREVVWDPNLEVLCSPTKSRAGPTDAGAGGLQLQPLPNKVAAWLYGRDLMAQATLKSKRKSGAPKIVRLKETRQYGPDSTLQVVYDDHVQLCYRREPRGFGVEIGIDNKERQLGYSEEDKALTSPYRRRPLPNLVTEWIRGAQSLVQLVSLPKETADTPTVDSLALDTSNKAVCSWSVKNTRYSCRLISEDGRYIFLGRNDKWHLDRSSVKQPPWEELWYSKEKGQWLLQLAGQNDVCIPVKAVAKVMESMEDLAWIDALRNDLTKSPWLKFPSPATHHFCSLIPGEGVSEAEKRLGHKFSNPSLLVEALTHCSASPDASPSCERLALVGEETLTAFVSLHFMDLGSIPITASASSRGVLRHDCLHCDTVAVPRELMNWREALERPLACRQAEGGASLEEYKRRVHACCNHASYARSCAQLQLPTLLRYESPELEMSIQRYLRATKRSQKACPPLAGAPRILGDVFLACLGALVLDGQRIRAEMLIEDHTKYCIAFENSIENVVFEQRQLSEANPGDITAIMGMVVSHAGAAINGLALAPPPPVPPAITQREKQDARARQERELERLRQKVGRYRDVCIVDAELDSNGMRPYGGVSPRAAILHKGRPLEDFEDHEPSQIDPAADGGAYDVKEFTGVYCKTCHLYLNGPMQWEDHKIGKRHRRNSTRCEKNQTPRAESTKSKGDEFSHQ